MAEYLADDRDDCSPAFAQTNLECPPSGWGFSRRELAAIKLRVPNSGKPWLDAMILESRRMDAAQAAMATMARLTKTGDTLLTFTDMAEAAEMAADALLKSMADR